MKIYSNIVMGAALLQPHPLYNTSKPHNTSLSCMQEKMKMKTLQCCTSGHLVLSFTLSWLTLLVISEQLPLKFLPSSVANFCWWWFASRKCVKKIKLHIIYIYRLKLWVWWLIVIDYGGNYNDENHAFPYTHSHNTSVSFKKLPNWLTISILSTSNILFEEHFPLVWFEKRGILVWPVIKKLHMFCDVEN